MDVVRDEIEVQIDRLSDEQFATFANEALVDLELTEPLDHREDRLYFPALAVEARESLSGVAVVVDDMVVQRHRLQEVQLQVDSADIIFNDEVLDEALFQVEEISGAVGGFPQPDDIGAGETVTDWFEVVAINCGVGRRKGNRCNAQTLAEADGPCVLVLFIDRFCWVSIIRHRRCGND